MTPIGRIVADFFGQNDSAPRQSSLRSLIANDLRIAKSFCQNLLIRANPPDPRQSAAPFQRNSVYRQPAILNNRIGVSFNGTSRFL